MSDQFEISEELPDHHYRTEIPNIVYDIKLSPAAFCVYANIKRIAGDKGACFKTIKNLADDCNMSENTLRDCLKEINGLKILIGEEKDGKQNFNSETKLVKITSRKKEDGSPDTNLIKIIDIWRLNGDVMRGKSIIKIIYGGSKSEGGVVQDLKGGGSKSEPKQEHLKKISLEEQQQTAAVFSCLQMVDIPQSDKIWLTQNHKEADVKHAVAFATHPETKINKSLAAAIKWACDEKPEIPICKETAMQDNRVLALEMAKKTIMPTGYYIECLNKYAEVGNGTHQPICVDYSEKGFKEQFENAIRKFGGNFK